MSTSDAPAAKLFTLVEVAGQLKCGEATVRRLVRGGMLRAAKVGGRLLVTADSLDALTRGDEPEAQP